MQVVAEHSTAKGKAPLTTDPPAAGLFGSLKQAGVRPQGGFGTF